MKFFDSDARQRICLDGLWQFLPTSQNQPPKNWKEAEDIVLPGCWNMQIPDFFYRKIAWVKREVCIPAHWPEEGWLFCGIHSWRISAWINDIHAGDHEGYLSTYFKVKLKPGKRNVFVFRMDSSESEERLGTRFDAMNYGGVFGKLVVESRGESYLEDITIRSELEGRRARLPIKVKSSGKGGELTLRVLDEDKEIASQRISLEPGQEKTADVILSVENPILWSLENPKLYQLEATLEKGKNIDQVSLCFGIRQITITSEGINLNGKPLSIRGMLTFNDHSDTGRYLPTHVILKDFWIAKKANVNAWRHHYPATQEFLDLADRYGFLVIESIPLVWDDDFTNPEIVRQAKEQLEEMIKRGENHPCIIGWGIWNEVGLLSDLYQSKEYKKRVREVTKELLDLAKRLDSKRFPLFATHLPLDDPCLDLPEVEVLGINLSPRIYALKTWQTENPLSAEVKKGVEIVAAIKKKAPDKPIILTEFGCQTLPGVRDFRGSNWSEDYQARLIEKFIPEMIKAGVCGFMFSCYADWTTRPVMKPPIIAERPAELGYWGMLDQYRRPKLVYDVIRELYGGMK